MFNLTALLSGIIFGFGLLLSGMSNPAKVTAFLDLAGNWDPSLAFVMAGAIAVATPAFVWAKRHNRSLLNAPMQLSAAGIIDRKLILGSAAFGIGWGLAGFCPGPALVSSAAGYTGAWIFTLAMVAGMGIYSFLTGKAARKHAPIHAPRAYEET